MSLIKTPKELENIIHEKTNVIYTENIETKEYIKTIFNKHVKSTNKNLADKSITLEFFDAKHNLNFEKFQTIGDWLFFSFSLYPKSLKGASLEYYQTVAQYSYYKCHQILKYEWKLFEELCDKFDYFTDLICKEFSNTK